MRLELELERRAEDLVAHVHDGVLVAARVQVVHGVLDDVQPLVARRLQVVLGRQVRPEGAGEAGVEPQITALRNTKQGCSHQHSPAAPPASQTQMDAEARGGSGHSPAACAHPALSLAAPTTEQLLMLLITHVSWGK